MENKNYDLKLARYIWSILKTQPIIVMSWGVDMDTIKPVKGGLEFHVQGFKHTGMVQIVLDEGKDLFKNESKNLYCLPPTVHGKTGNLRIGSGGAKRNYTESLEG